MPSQLSIVQDVVLAIWKWRIFAIDVETVATCRPEKTVNFWHERLPFLSFESLSKHLPSCEPITILTPNSSTEHQSETP